MTHDLVLVSVLVGALVALAPPLYGPARHIVTAVHEVGHAVVALCAGRSLRSVRLNRDSSGEAVSVGPSRGLGVVLTLLAGYPAPTVVGLAGIWAVREGREEAWLVGMLVVLALMVVLLRGVFGFLVAAAMILTLVALLRWAQPATGAVVVASLSWFLLLGAVRSVLDLWGPHAGGSDAQSLRRITAIPAAAWALVFLALDAAGVVLALHLAGLLPG